MKKSNSFQWSKNSFFTSLKEMVKGSIIHHTFEKFRINLIYLSSWFYIDNTKENSIWLVDWEGWGVVYHFKRRKKSKLNLRWNLLLISISTPHQGADIDYTRNPDICSDWLECDITMKCRRIPSLLMKSSCSWLIMNFEGMKPKAKEKLGLLVCYNWIKSVWGGWKEGRQIEREM